MDFSRFFIDRPIFAAVLSIVIFVAGLAALPVLPVSEYPEVVPPSVVVRTVYPGANPKVIAETVATPLEEAINGVEGMMYIKSVAGSDGVLQITVTFRPGIDADDAAVRVQNRVSQALARLPEDVRRQGVTTQKQSPTFLMVVHLTSPDGRYDTLYLRAHYPAEYYCALLNNQPMGFYAPRVLVGDARKHGVMTLPVHVNRSLAECSLEGDAIRLGLQYVDGLGETAIDRFLAAREESPFRDLADLCRRTRLPRRLVERIILARGMECWEMDQRRLLWTLGGLRYEAETLPLEYVPAAPDGLEPMTEEEALLAEYGATGLAAEGHLMEAYRERMDRLGVVTSQDLAHAAPGEAVSVAGMVVIRQAPPTAKGFVFLTLEDEFGLMNVIVRPDVFALQRGTWATGRILVVQGHVERFGHQINVMATQAWQLR